MICTNRFMRCTGLAMLMILPVNFRLGTKSFVFVEDMMGIEPTVWGNSTDDTESEGLIASTLNSGIDSLLSFGANFLDEDDPASQKEDEEAGEEEVSLGQDKQNEASYEDGEEGEGEEETTQEDPINILTPSKGGSALPEQNQIEDRAANGERTDLTPIASNADLDTFGGCLQIMDDNHFLIEWLAYHYHVMPMRRLIVMLDPKSRSSPQPILDRWKGRMNITVWEESDLYPKGHPNKDSTVLFQFRQRQKYFVKTCLKTLLQEKLSWALLTDTDEYTMISERVRDPKDFLSPATYAAGKNVRIPEQDEPGSVLKFLQTKDAMNAHTNETLRDTPCITIGRKIFGTLAEENQPPYMGYEAEHFQTLLWQKWATTPKPGKSMINLRAIKAKDISNSPSIHRPLLNKLCAGKMWLPETLSVIVANHYPGTLEQMLFRQDDARGVEADNNATKYRVERFNDYKKLSKLRDKNTIRKWLPGFIATVGEEEAKRLLQYAGRPKEASYLDAEALQAPPADLQELSSANFAAKKPSARVPENQGGTTAQPVKYLSLASDPKDDPNTFAGCLQIMDDNHFLIEWLAYHYHVLPLRRLIVLVDPHSQTSPAPILERWKDRMHITLWSEDYVFPNGIPPLPDKKKNHTLYMKHRSRQREFVRLCVEALKEENREWVVLTDTDEYTMINDRVRNKKQSLSPLKYAADKGLEIPSQREEGSVLKFLRMKDVIIPSTNQTVWDNPCITMARKTFGTKTLNATGQVAGYNISDFQTLNWRYFQNTGKPGKALANLRLVKFQDIPKYPSVHRPFTNEDICKGSISPSEWDSILVVNHYPGNLRQMLFRRADARAFRANGTDYRLERFHDYKNFDKKIDTETVQEWLPGFVESVGSEEAERLLEFVGDPDLSAGPMDPDGKPFERGPPITEIGKPTTHLEIETVVADAVSREDPNSFASCLMINGENPLLPEWIAYHYHVLPLRRLIIFEGPDSQSSAKYLVDRWQEDMDITIWDKENIAEENSKTAGRMFIRRCLKALHEEGREWMLISAVDEYATINDRVRNPKNKLSPFSQVGEHPPLPAPSSPGSILQLLRRDDLKILHTDENAKDSACITMSRKTFSDRKGLVPTTPPPDFDATHLQTMKWGYYADEGLAGRSLVNLKKVQPAQNIPLSPSPNRPVDGLCEGTLRLKEFESVIVINRYNRGKDLGRTLRDNRMESDTIQAWLAGFVASVGVDKAKELLAGPETEAFVAADEWPGTPESAHMHIPTKKRLSG